jgi:hypothetical protein
MNIEERVKMFSDSQDEKKLKVMVYEMINKVTTKYGLEAVESQAFSLLGENVLLNYSFDNFWRLVEILAVLV